MNRRVVLLKAYVKGYTRKDGTYVRPYTTKTPSAKGKAGPGQKSLLSSDGKPAPEPLPASAVPHPVADENGEEVMIHYPSKPTAPETWNDPQEVATFVPGSPVPAELNGVAFAPWEDHPVTEDGWDYIDGVDDDLDEPPLNVPAGKKISSGVVIEEPDGRVWLTAPTNAFGGYKASFPKGTAEPELSLQANAIKEVFEETGLQVKIVGFLGDYTRTTSVARMYRAVRVGGTPSAMGWESQAVHLAPKDKLYDLLNMSSDHGIAQEIGAGEPPTPKKGKDSGQSDLFDF